MRIYFVLLCLLFWGNTFSQERIYSYDSYIEVERSGDLLVRETITVQAEGNSIKRGIYRSFPTNYKDKFGTRFRVGFDVVEVLKNGVAEPHFTKKENNGIVLYIGDENTMLPKGRYTYTITYRTSRQIGFYEDFDELYFNAIGGDWSFMIENVVVRILLPDEAVIQQMEAFSGAYQSTGCDCTTEFRNNQAKIILTQALLPGSQLTFAVAWQKGVVQEPTPAEKRKLFFKDNFHVIFAFFGLVFVFILYYSAWRRVGVDPPKGTIIPLFDPPKDYSPAAVGYVFKMYFSQRALSSAIVNMAVKGFLKITNSEKGKFTLQKTGGDTGLLSKEERAIAETLFSEEDTIALDNENHKQFLKARASVINLLKQKMKPKYFSLNGRYLGKGITASVIISIFAFILSPSPAIPVILVVALFILLIVFVELIKAPSVEGRKLMDEIEGFKMYLSVAEQRQLDALHEPDLTPERFEALLPYAIALGVENQWGKKFENALSKSFREAGQYHPSWYVASGMGAFSPSAFSKSVGQSFSSAISSASTPPGSSSGSGGGGFSGGGGGGGGGGGW